MSKPAHSQTETDDPNSLPPAPAPTPGRVGTIKRERQPRFAARVAAVQALYQMDIAKTDVAGVIAQFTDARFPNAENDDLVAGADEMFFSELLRGVIRRQRDIDPLIDERLADGWRLARLDRTLGALMRAATFEIVDRQDVPARVVINEYIDIAHAFFEGDEPKVVNGVLDRLARTFRSAEFQ